MTPGTAETVVGTEWLSCAGPVAVTMRSALIAWSTLLVADRDTEAPNTDIAATRARPTMSAEAVWAVRRGLRMEFSRPELARFPEQPGQRTADHAGQRPGDRRGQHGDADEDADGADADERDGRLGQPDGQQDHADQGHGRAPGEPAPERGVGVGPAVVERGDRRDPHGVAGRADRGDDRDADADGEARPPRCAARTPAVRTAG